MYIENFCIEDGHLYANYRMENNSMAKVDLGKVVGDDGVDGAPPAVCTAKGEAIVVTDSAEQKPNEFKLFGKTTQDDTPTVEKCVEGVHVGMGGKIDVMFGGKNLFPVYADTGVALGITRELQNDGSYKFSGTSEITQWTNWINLVGTIPADGVYTLTADADVFTSRGIHFSHKRDNTEIKVFAQTKKVVYTAEMLKGDTVRIMLGTTESEVVNTNLYVQLETGNTSTSFEKPKNIQNITVLTPNGLPGIKVSSGGNWKDSTGQQWASNYKDLVRYVNGHWVGIHSFTGDEEIWLYGAADYALPLWAYPTHKTADFGGVCSNALQGVNSFGAVMDTDNTIVAAQGSIAIHFAGMQGVGDNTPYPTSDDLTNAAKAKLKELHNAGTPLTVIYQLAEPYETDFTEEEKAYYAEQHAVLHTNYPVTTILNDEGVSMEVSYVADTKNYIDNKFNKLAVATVENI